MKSIGSEWQPVVTSDGSTAVLHADAQHAAARDGDVARRQRALAAREHAASGLRPRRRSSTPQPVIDHRHRRHADPRAAVHAEGSEGRREAAGADLLPRRIAPADAARLALQLLLPQRLRDESVARQPGLHRAVGELSQRHRLRPGIPRSAQLRRVGRRRVQRRDGRGAVSEESRRCRSGAHRAVGRIVRRLPDGDGPVARVRSVRRRRRLPRRARLEPGHPTFVPDYNVLDDPDFSRARLCSLADGAASTPGSRRCC